MEKAVFLGNFSGNTSMNSSVESKAMDEWQQIVAAKANPKAFERLYDTHFEAIFNFVYYRIGGDVNLTDDLCQQTFLKAMQALPKYEDRGVPFVAWLRRIALNEINQHFRQSGKRPVVCLEDKHSFEFSDEDGTPDKVELEIQIETLQRAIQEMKPDEVEYIRLRFFEKHSFKEIADIFQITENNAKVKTHRILGRLREIFMRYT